VSDDLSLGELGRIIQALRGDVRDDMAQIQQRLDRLVSLDVYTVEKAALSKDIADLTKTVEQLTAKHDKDIKDVHDQRNKDADRVTQTRRWMVGTVLIPLLGLILPVAIFLGGKS
jgi:histidinol dehydrogenase